MVAINFELMDQLVENAVIKVIGIGGGGGNAIENMIISGVEGVEFICANTDAQALKNTKVDQVIQLGANMTKGLGAGADPEVGRESALEAREQIAAVLAGADMVFITAGMGGGTGTGAAPVVAEIAKELGILTVAVVTKPFPFEGAKRHRIAEQGIVALKKSVDSLIIIPNAKLLKVFNKNESLLNVFKAANNVLLGAVQGIAELITRPGLINVDFADVRTVMSAMGMAMMGTGRASGEDRAAIAAAEAVSSPLLEDINLAGAKGLLVNITSGLDMTISEFETVGDSIRAFTSEEATVIVGTVIDPEMQGELRVTIVATGLEAEAHSQPKVELAKNPEESVATSMEQLTKSTEEPAKQPSTATSPPPAPSTATTSPLQPSTAAMLQRTHADLELNDANRFEIPAFLRRKLIIDEVVEPEIL